MLKIYQTIYEVAGPNTKLRDVLEPRVLAEGYYLQHSDAGKQVFGRNVELLKRGFWGAKLGAATVQLVVGYVYLPTQTKVVFTWEAPPDTCIRQDDLHWAFSQAKVFYDYLNQWWANAQESKHIGDGEGGQ